MPTRMVDRIRRWSWSCATTTAISPDASAAARTTEIPRRETPQAAAVRAFVVAFDFGAVKVVTGRWTGAGDLSLGLADIAAALGIEHTLSLPAYLDLGLKSASFEYHVDNRDYEQGFHLIADVEILGCGFTLAANMGEGQGLSGTAAKIGSIDLGFVTFVAPHDGVAGPQVAVKAFQRASDRGGSPGAARARRDHRLRGIAWRGKWALDDRQGDCAVGDLRAGRLRAAQRHSWRPRACDPGGLAAALRSLDGSNGRWGTVRLGRTQPERVFRAAARERLASRGHRISRRSRSGFVADSLLEEDGFEPSVPLARMSLDSRGGEGATSRSGCLKRRHHPVIRSCFSRIPPAWCANRR